MMNLNRFIVIWASVGLTGLLTGCGIFGNSGKTHTQDIENIYANIYAPVTQPYRELSAATKEELLRSFSQLRSNDTPDRVLKTVGCPNDFYIGAPKEHVDAKPIGAFWHYYLTRPTSRPLNDRIDKYVSLFFDANNRLVSLHSTEAGLPSWRKSEEN